MTRIRFGLNATMTQEALLIERIRCLPNDRREEYVRNLLLKGFEQECRDATENSRANDRQCAKPSQMLTPTVQEERGPLVADASAQKERVETTLTSLKNVVG